uniref:Uncharacterized protein n=1 Tax=Avena sativa TaxID=4498 RepID=A0ACD5YAW7_AVESA
MTRKSRGKTKRKTASSSTLVVPSPPTVEPQAAATEAAPIDVLPELVLSGILRRLSLADLIRAALASHRWRRLASRCLPRTPPLLGYFFHPTEVPPPYPDGVPEIAHTPAVFAPIDASAPHLSLDFAPDAFRFHVYDSHQGLLLLEPSERFSGARGCIPRFLVLDPATRRRTVLSPPPRDTVPDDRRWRSSRYYVGSALLSRTHPSKLCFEAVCFAIDGGHPRAWVASVDNDQCCWRALPRDEQVLVDFDPYWFEGRPVHAAGKIYWHICRSWRLLVLDPSTLRFSNLPVPDALSSHNHKYRVGETPDGRLCLVTDAQRQLQLWVRGNGRRSDNGWILERKIVDLLVLCDMMRGLPSDPMLRTLCVWPSDMDAGRTGKVFIETWGFGRFSFHMDTGKMERLSTKRGKEYGHPMFAYFLAWPPAFLAQEN